MDLAVSRDCTVDRGTWLREPSQRFILATRVDFSEEERWVIGAHHLYQHIVLDRTPPWYFGALREAERAKERAEKSGEAFEWPRYLPPSVPPEWKLTVARLLADPVYTVTFDSAHELAGFEPRLMAAFREFAEFLRAYGSRPGVVHRRL